MFILCGLILEAGENLFRDFWSPFSIFFSSTRNYFKKTNRPTGRVRLGLLARPAFISREAQVAAPPNPSAAAALAPPPRRAAAAPPEPPPRRRSRRSDPIRFVACFFGLGKNRPVYF